MSPQAGARCTPRFSALQRAENSSINGKLPFQNNVARSFSALQRAENSSIFLPRRDAAQSAEFQCSSASRKFLNNIGKRDLAFARFRFSALQRAENSSMVILAQQNRCSCCFSALQRAENSSIQGMK